jgi:hypothetical protein
MSMRADGSFTMAARTVRGSVVVAVCGVMFVGACSSSASKATATTTTAVSSTPPTTPSAPTQKSTPTTGSPATSATPASTTLKKCPSAAMVNTALGQHDSGPVVSGTSVYEICTYKGSGVIPTKVTISEGTRTEFAASEHNVAASLTVVSVPGLGDEAWGLKGAGTVFVLKGSVQVEVLSPLSTDTQVQALARQII